MENNAIKKILSKRNITQAEMARNLNMTPQRICDILNGRLKGYKYRSRICRYLGIDEETLFPDSD